MSFRQRSNKKKRAGIVILVFFSVLFLLGLVQFGKYIPVLFDLFFKKEIELHQTKENRINLLILGIGGGNHDGPNLSDTIIFTSLDPVKQKLTLVSLPRDLWIPELKQKINYAYADGEAKRTGGGLLEAKAAVRKVTGQEIDYAIRIDFNGFVKAVDMIGGLDIVVDNTFDDYQYPIEGKEDDACGHTDEEIADLSEQIATSSATELDAFPCRYEHLHFDKGKLHVNGTTALKFVRSRHGTGVEGSDFARSKRQEKIISAFKEKIFSLDTFLNPVKVINLVNILKDSIDTDIKTSEYDDFIKLAKKMRGAKVESAVVDAGDDENGRLGLLKNPPITDEFNNQWVLIPRIGNGRYSEISDYLNCQLATGDCIINAKGIVKVTPTPPEK